MTKNDPKDKPRELTELERLRIELEACTAAVLSFRQATGGSVGGVSITMTEEQHASYCLLKANQEAARVRYEMTKKYLGE